MKARFLILTSILVLCVFPAWAQQKGSNEPLEITADNSLEWHRESNVFIARGKAKAAQGDVSIAAETLAADYRDKEGSGVDIWKVTADTDVVITSADSKAFGGHAVYNLDEGLATLTEGDLALVSGNQTVTARDRFEYWTEEGKLIAIGRAKMTQLKEESGEDTLEADLITAFLHDDAEGKREIETLEAEGRVIITSPQEIITGDYAIYRKASNTAEIKGNVVIQRGPNTLEGERAEVDLNTNISRMFGSEGEGGRIRGVFYPGSQ